MAARNNLATRLPDLSGLAWYMVVVEANYSSDDYAETLEDKLHCFLVVLQNRVPRVLSCPSLRKPILPKTQRRHWRESKIENGCKICEMRRAASYRSRALTARSRRHCCPQLPTLTTCATLATVIRAFFIPLRMRAAALAVFVADNDDMRCA